VLIAVDEKLLQLEPAVAAGRAVDAVAAVAAVAASLAELQLDRLQLLLLLLQIRQGQCCPLAGNAVSFLAPPNHASAVAWLGICCPACACTEGLVH
jgi:hypothetical protein